MILLGSSKNFGTLSWPDKTMGSGSYIPMPPFQPSLWQNYKNKEMKHRVMGEPIYKSLRYWVGLTNLGVTVRFSFFFLRLIITVVNSLEAGSPMMLPSSCS